MARPRPLIGRSRPRDWNLEARNAAARFRFLEEMIPCESELAADAGQHALRSRRDPAVAGLGKSPPFPRRRDVE